MLKDLRWTPTLRGQIADRASLTGLLPDWQNLCSRAAEDNVYYSPRYAQALLNTVERDANLRFALVWEEDRLVAFLPFSIPSFSLPYYRVIGRAWQSKYTFSCTPLLDRSRKAESAAALIDTLATVCSGEWLIPVVNVDGEVARAIVFALESQGHAHAFIDSFQRSSLRPNGSFDNHMEQYVSSKRRKELARTRRRMEKLGKCEHRAYCHGESLSQAVAEFLSIERQGWKGKRGTALDCKQNTRDFALQAFTGHEGNSTCRADVLTLEGKPIAVSLAVFAGTTAFTVKCTYDERYRSYGAGLLLEVEVLRSFLQERWAERLDAATAGSHVIDELWSDRLQVADLMFSLSPHTGRDRLNSLRLCEGLKRRAKSHVRQILGRQ